MIYTIRTDGSLCPLLQTVVQDVGITVNFNPRVDIVNDVAILKIDDYYNNLRQPDTPKSIDNIVVIDCRCKCYVMYLFELKSTRTSGKVKVSDIHEKFDTAIYDFISTRFSSIFLSNAYKYKRIFLYTIMKSTSMSNYPDYATFIKAQNRSRNLTYDKEMSMASKLYKIKGHICMIKFEIPPNPIMDYLF